MVSNRAGRHAQVGLDRVHAVAGVETLLHLVKIDCRQHTRDVGTEGPFGASRAREGTAQASTGVGTSPVLSCARRHIYGLDRDGDRSVAGRPRRRPSTSALAADPVAVAVESVRLWRQDAESSMRDVSAVQVRWRPPRDRRADGFGRRDAKTAETSAAARLAFGGRRCGQSLRIRKLSTTNNTPTATRTTATTAALCRISQVRVRRSGSSRRSPAIR